MNPQTDKNYIRVHKTAALVLVAILIAGLLGWLLGRGDSSSDAVPVTSTQTTTPTANNAPGVASLVSYVLPDGWKQVSCEGSVAIFFVPSGMSEVDCKPNPSSAIKLSVDPGNNTDCNQLQGVSDVKKHVCISLFINNHKSLKSSTEYLASSSYKQATTIDSYYINTGKGVVRVDYIYTTDNEFQAGFEQLAKSVKAK